MSFLLAIAWESMVFLPEMIYFFCGFGLEERKENDPALRIRESIWPSPTRNFPKKSPKAIKGASFAFMRIRSIYF
jgi:hypothetical protein